MLKEALELIQKTAREAVAPKLVPELSGDRRTAWVFVGNELREVPLDPPVRAHEVRSLADLIAYARDIGGQDKPGDPACVVWHSREAVVLVLDDADRRDRVTFPLHYSLRFAMLQKLVKERPLMKQSQFVRMLRIDLGLPAPIVNQWRKLDWETGVQTRGEVRHGADRLGKEIRAACTGIEDLPDEVVIECPVYLDAGERQEYPIRCAVELDTLNTNIQLLPLPDELERVEDLAQASIRDRLERELVDVKDKASIPVYHGTP